MHTARNTQPPPTQLVGIVRRQACHANAQPWHFCFHHCPPQVFPGLRLFGLVVRQKSGKETRPAWHLPACTRGGWGAGWAKSANPSHRTLVNQPQPHDTVLTVGQ